jgi:hypothetical protein
MRVLQVILGLAAVDLSDDQQCEVTLSVLGSWLGWTYHPP